MKVILRYLDTVKRVSVTGKAESEIKNDECAERYCIKPKNERNELKEQRSKMTGGAKRRWIVHR